MTNTPTESLREHARKLLDTSISTADSKAIIDDIHELFTSLTGLSGKDSNFERLAAIETAYGSALGLNYAALCLVDYQRTTTFLKGMVAAIHKKQQEFPDEPVKVFYAGCGPYAPFVTLVAPLFDPTELQFTILDLNPESLNFAQNLIKKCGLEAYMDDVILDDAITCTVPNAEQYHILFSETLDTMLSRECYVPILYNLKAQFPEGTIILPENVQIALAFISKDKEGNEVAGNSQVVFDAKQAIDHSITMKSIPASFPSLKVSVPQDQGIVAILLDTLVHVHEDLGLERGASQLTTPTVFSIDDDAQFDTLVFTYNLKPSIGLFTGTELSGS